MFISLVLNIFGIYSLFHVDESKHQRTLLTSLSLIEIAKIINDYFGFSLFNYYGTWYRQHQTLFDMAEVTLMTILYLSIILISLDRLLCILLKVNYNRYVTDSNVQRAVIFVWVLGIIAGSIMRLTGFKDERGKIIYYAVIDICVLIVAAVTYLLYGKLVIERSRRFTINTTTNNNTENLKKFLVPSLIIISFIIFNVVPDLVAIKYFDDTIMYHYLTCLWIFGYNVDPIIYIFLDKKRRTRVFDIFRYMKSNCCQRVVCRCCYYCCCCKGISTSTSRV